MARKQSAIGDAAAANAAENAARSALQQGHQAYEQRAWADAYAAYAQADAQAPLELDDLARMALAAGLSGNSAAQLAGLERMYEAQLQSGQPMPAARSAFWLAMRLFPMREPGRAGGWLARGQRLVEAQGEECAEHGYLMLPASTQQLAAGDPDAAYATAARACAIGERFGEADLVTLARSQQGRACLRRGELSAGLALLDEAMLAVTRGELSPATTGVVYCSAISSCHQVYALGRAREWTAALAQWCATQPQLRSFTGACLVHRAEIMQLGGAWDDAIEEARLCCERAAHGGDTEATGDGLYQRAEIHRLRGEVAQAEEAYRNASQLGREPQPGLALLRLAQGQTEAAAAAIRRALGATTDRLRRALFLPACVEILLAAGAIEEAAAASVELAAIAASYPSEILGAIAGHAHAAICLARGDARGALQPLRRAFVIWRDVEAPYLAARVRVLLGRACAELGDHDGHELECAAARATFAQLGAALDLAALDACSVTETQTAPRDAHGLSPRELEVLRMLATGKTNKLIAQALFVSEKTIDRHVSNIFAKLQVGSRAAATAFAFTHGLL